MIKFYSVDIVRLLTLVFDLDLAYAILRVAEFLSIKVMLIMFQRKNFSKFTNLNMNNSCSTVHQDLID